MLLARDSIVFKPGFHAQSGLRPTAKIDSTIAPVDQTDYIRDIEYRNLPRGMASSPAQGADSTGRDGIVAIYHPAGRAVPDGSTWRHEYVITDHLGNTRLRFSDLDGSGTIDSTELLSTHDYYPFGLQWNAGGYKYTYNGKEIDRELGLNWHHYGKRMYDAVLGRFTGVDPLADDYASWSPYNYVMGNPVKLIDPDGRSVESTIVEENEDGTFSVIGGDPNDGDREIYIDDGSGGKGEKLGESLTSHSFFGDDDQAIVGAVINLNSTEGQDFLESEIVATDIGLIEYIANAKGGEPLDFKTRDIENRPAGTSREQYQYRGSVTSSGKIGSARDFGNIGAGIVAGRNGLGWGDARLGFDGLQSIQEGRLATEGVPTQKAQRLDFNIGLKLRSKDSYYRSFRPFQKTVIKNIDL